eukprot:scaffold253161_cov23-Tisochrysis_lutea.AAC.6
MSRARGTRRVQLACLVAVWASCRRRAWTRAATPGRACPAFGARCRSRHGRRCARRQHGRPRPDQCAPGRGRGRALARQSSHACGGNSLRRRSAQVVRIRRARQHQRAWRPHRWRAPSTGRSGPIDACHDSIASPIDEIVSNTSRTEGRQISHRPSRRLAAFGATRIRATGCCSNSRSTPRDVGALAYASHSAPSERSTSSSRPTSEPYSTVHSSPRVAVLKVRRAFSISTTAASHDDQSESSPEAALDFLRAGVAGGATSACCSASRLGSSGGRSAAAGLPTKRSKGPGLAGRSQGVSSSSSSWRTAWTGESSFSATSPGSSAPAGRMPRAATRPSSETHIGMAAASLPSKSCGASRASLTGFISTCSGHARQHARDAVAPHLEQRTMSGATPVRPSEGHMRAEPAASVSSSASGTLSGLASNSSGDVLSGISSAAS